MKVIFAKSAARELRRLNRAIQDRIRRKLRFYASQTNPLNFAKLVKDFRFGNWRFRIGDYRIIFDIEKDKIVVLKIGHRKDIYK